MKKKLIKIVGITDFERLTDFNNWLAWQPAKHKIVTAGNWFEFIYCKENMVDSL